MMIRIFLLFTFMPKILANRGTRPSLSDETSERRILRVISRTIQNSWRENETMEKELETFALSIQKDNAFMSMSIPPVASPTAKPVSPPLPPRTKPPTAAPKSPTSSPSRSSTLSPTTNPSDSPTHKPTSSPRALPTPLPTAKPTRSPTPSPTKKPTPKPSPAPTHPCNVDPKVRDTLITVILSSVSSTKDMEKPGTPQNLARNWILRQDTRYLCPNDSTLIQRYSMAVFYFSTEGQRWFQCSAPSKFDDPKAITRANSNCNIEIEDGSGSDAWLTPSSECQWGGTECNDSGSMTQIEIEANGLAGVLNSELGSLSELTKLSIQDAAIEGVIPPEYGKLTSVKVIDLNYNFIGGSIPEQIFDISGLRELDLNDNRLTGTLSKRIGELRNLEFLQLHNNQLNGFIPGQLGNIISLETATLNNNNFQGSMPQSVCDLRERNLDELTADCLMVSGRRSPPFVGCSCCSQCF